LELVSSPTDPGVDVHKVPSRSPTAEEVVVVLQRDRGLTAPLCAALAERGYEVRAASELHRAMDLAPRSDLVIASAGKDNEGLTLLRWLRTDELLK
jgi:DNA-binding response OmpR family regulator